MTTQKSLPPQPPPPTAPRQMLSEYLIIFWIKERQDLQGWEMDWKYAWRVQKNNQLDGLANITSEFKYGLIQKKEDGI